MLLKNLQDNFLYRIVDKPTRYRYGQKPSLLDLVITTDEGVIGDIAYGAALGKSDHIVLSFYLRCYTESAVGDSEERFLYHTHKDDYSKMNDDLSRVKWDDELDKLDVNEAWKFFCNQVNQAMEKSIPKTKPVNTNRFETSRSYYGCLAKQWGVWRRNIICGKSIPGQNSTRTTWFT